MASKHVCPQVVSFQLNNSGKSVLRFQFPELPAPLAGCLQLLVLYIFVRLCAYSNTFRHPPAFRCGPSGCLRNTQDHSISGTCTAWHEEVAA